MEAKLNFNTNTREDDCINSGERTKGSAQYVIIVFIRPYLIPKIKLRRIIVLLGRNITDAKVELLEL